MNWETFEDISSILPQIISGEFLSFSLSFFKESTSVSHTNISTSVFIYVQYISEVVILAYFQFHSFKYLYEICLFIITFCIQHFHLSSISLLPNSKWIKTDRLLSYQKVWKKKQTNIGLLLFHVHREKEWYKKKKKIQHGFTKIKKQPPLWKLCFYDSSYTDSKQPA